MTKVLADINLFKNLVKQMKLSSTDSQKKDTFSDVIFRGSAWYCLKRKMTLNSQSDVDHKNKNKDNNKDKNNDDNNKVAAQKQLSDEKIEAIQSLNKFVEKKFEISSKNLFRVKGGEVSAKVDQLNEVEFEISKFLNKQTICSHITTLQSQYTVAFIGLEPKDSKHGDLLSKMIKATEICDNHFLKIYISKETTVDELFYFLKNTKIDYLVSLGARATNLILNSENKMTEVHGKFFNLKVKYNEEITSSMVMPLFHPDFLNINSSMKKSAWTDLQKLMSRII